MNESDKDNEVPTFDSMEEEAQIDYDVPNMKPHILVDQTGFLPTSTKQALFFGEIIPSVFRVKDVSTGEVVYENTLETRGYSEEYSTNIAYGDFSVLTKEGRYYIEADMFGSSYEFDIREGIYSEILDDSVRNYYYNRCGVTLTEGLAGDKAHGACHTGKAILRSDVNSQEDVSGGWHQDETGSKDIETAAEVLSDMLLSYEIFPSVFSDEVGIPESGNDIPDILDEAKFEIEWMFKMQSQKTGAVYSGVTIVSDGNRNSTIYVEEPTLNATAAFASVLAKYSYLYQSYDKDFSTKCLKAADRAWKYVVLNGKDEEIGWKICAAAEIYRASGSKDCKKYLDEYFSSNEVVLDDGNVYRGCITYINTPMSVEIDYCEKIIRMIMKEAERISADSRNSSFLVPFKEDKKDNEELLSNMITMSLVDYIIANHEYDNIIENYMHYFLGRNPDGMVFVSNDDKNDDSVTFDGIMQNFEMNAKLIFMLSKLNSIKE